MNASIRKSILLALGALSVLGGSAAPAHDNPVALATSRGAGEFSPLVNKVRRATERFRDINVALGEQWVQATPCVSGPNSGAMGIHLVMPSRIGDGVLKADEPEALIYEPLPGGRWRLVGVEFIEIAAVWDAQVGGQPKLEGHLLNLVSGPNRYALPAFYELHVWAWQNNPNGSFADWNTSVSCDKQPLD
jgi:hypothetical protein